MLHPLISLALAQARADDLLRERRRADGRPRADLPDDHLQRSPRRLVARLIRRPASLEPARAAGC
ncbi:MAG: hypothetical protein JWR85_2183 [Marmoricola sp.]|nr:hypothetical protein [Marmoricola sp.]